MKKEFTYTATSYNDEYVFEYIVCWRERATSVWDWKRTFFANKKTAQKFARERKHENKTKPYPYIIKQITTRKSFKDDVKCESAENAYKTVLERVNYRKYIKY